MTKYMNTNGTHHFKRLLAVSAVIGLIVGFAPASSAKILMNCEHPCTKGNCKGCEIVNKSGVANDISQRMGKRR